jgi:hypothetical protein
VTRRSASATLIGALALTGCADRDDPVGPAADSAAVQMTAAGFPAFASGQGRFELWISFAAAPGEGLRRAGAASCGTFTIDGGGRPVGPDGAAAVFRVDPDDPDVPRDADGTPLWALVSDAFVTIEEADDPEPDVPGPALLAGAFRNGAAVLAPAHDDAIGETFLGLGGSFLLATPSTPETDDEAQGVWFVGISGWGVFPSLMLPALPADGDWTYAGWVSLPSAGEAPLGAFTDPQGTDGDGAGPLGGSGYPYPGSDFPFFGAHTDLTPGASVFVTLQPRDSPHGAGPFFVTLLGAPVPNGTAPGTSVSLVPDPDPFPAVTVSVQHGGS